MHLHSFFGIRVAFACAVVGLALGGCGGGGGGGGGANSPTAAAPVVFGGTAATGRPMTGATVRVIDGRSVEVARSQALGVDGRYSVELASAATAPFVLVAELPDGEAQVCSIDKGESSTVNITQVTSLMAARLSSNGTPKGLEADFKGDGGRTPPTPQAIRTSTSEVIAMLAPLAQALGDSTHPVTGSFAVDGTGYDKLLDSVAVAIVPTSNTAANIEVTLRTKRAEDEPMPAVMFSSADPTLPAVASVAANQLIGSGTSARIERLVEVLNACYQLPLADRVEAGINPPQIKAGPCRSLFFGSDPSNYLHSGTRVGSGAFGGLLAGSLVTFDRPVLEYVRSDNNDVVFTLRFVDANSNTDTLMLFAREEGNELRLIGDRYQHSISVSGSAVHSDHLNADDVGLDHVTVGPQFVVANRLDGTGQSIYDRVVVVAPVGFAGNATRDEFVLRPYVGYTSLRMQGNWDSAHTSQVIRLAGEFKTARSSEPLHPRQVSSSGAVWVAGEPWTDERIESMSHKAVWTFQYFLAGNTGTAPDMVQHMTTISRVPSVREALQMSAAQFDAPTLETLRSMSREPAAPNLFWFGARPNATGAFPTIASPLTLAWTVPDGAVAPTRATLWGRATASYTTLWAERTPFDAGQPIPSTTRQKQMDCPTTIISNILCDPVDPTRLSLKTLLTNVNIWARDARFVEVDRQLNIFRPALRPMQ